jgi:hypothetical protein
VEWYDSRRLMLRCDLNNDLPCNEAFRMLHAAYFSKIEDPKTGVHAGL